MFGVYDADCLQDVIWLHAMVTFLLDESLLGCVQEQNYELALRVAQIGLKDLGGDLMYTDRMVYQSL